jgi:2'-5' RNA ligase
MPAAPGACRAVTIGVPLDGDHAAAVDAIRRRLEVPSSPRPLVPHLSLAVLLEVPPDADIDGVITEIASRTPPFSVRARGFGVFHDGDGGLVLHLPVVRTAALALLHDAVVDAFTAAGRQIEGHYTAASWFPHVTLWAHTLTPALLRRAIGRLATGPPLGWTLPVTRLVRLESTGVTAEALLEGPPPSSS